MSKFNRTIPAAVPQSATAVLDRPALTHEGGIGSEKDPKTALYTLAVTNMVGEPTFYESGKDRDSRFLALIHEVTKSDPEWMQGFIPWLRDGANMRSASIVAAVEYLRAGGPRADAVIDAACQRADEPGELLGYYWSTNQGRRTIANPIKRGLAAAAGRLYNEYACLKYDTPSSAVRFGDVIDLTHARPTGGEWQSVLFRHLLDRRRGYRDDIGEKISDLPRLAAAYSLDDTPEGERRAALSDTERLSASGYTWERLSGWLPGGMDAEAWEAVIPNMGHMALIRNLRNFEEAKIGKAVIAEVAARIADPEAVAKGRQFPYRYWSAFKNSGTIAFGPALEAALEASVANVPEFTGRTLVACDTSGSMQSVVSGRSKVQMFEIAALFAATVASKSDARMIQYGDTYAEVPISSSVLRTIQSVEERIGTVGHGTQTWPSVIDAFGQYQADRIIVFTDMQDHPASPRVGYGYYDRRPSEVGSTDLPDVPIYVWDLAGYGAANIENRPGRYLFGGFTDAAFRLIRLLESGRDAGWPWEV